MHENANFRNEFYNCRGLLKFDFIIKVIKCPIPLLLGCQCDVGLII